MGARPSLAEALRWSKHFEVARCQAPEADEMLKATGSFYTALILTDMLTGSQLVCTHVSRVLCVVGKGLGCVVGLP